VCKKVYLFAHPNKTNNFDLALDFCILHQYSFPVNCCRLGNLIAPGDEMMDSSTGAPAFGKWL
jgi:hypothetical protein